MLVENQSSEMTGARHVLVVEDEESVRQRMVSLLQFEGYEVEGVAEVGDAIRMLGSQAPDVILCDIMMSKGDGVDLVSLVRSRADFRLTPIVMVTALTERRWQRRFMELGVDDYLTKPFRAAELIKAVETQCAKLDWRAEAAAAASPGRSRTFAGRTFDPLRRVLILEDSQETSLTAKEAELLMILLDHAGTNLSRESIMKSMGREFDPLDRMIDVLIGRLRRLVGDDPRKATLIRTVRGKGYVLDAKIGYD